MWRGVECDRAREAEAKHTGPGCELWETWPCHPVVINLLSLLRTLVKLTDKVHSWAFVSTSYIFPGLTQDSSWESWRVSVVGFQSHLRPICSGLFQIRVSTTLLVPCLSLLAAPPWKLWPSAEVHDYSFLGTYTRVLAIFSVCRTPINLNFIDLCVYPLASTTLSWLL